MEISNYVGKTIIAWHYYNENYVGEYVSSPNRRSYVYPRILKKSESEFIPIINSESEFPKKGRIEVKIAGELTAAELYDEVGKIVEIQMNTIPEYNFASNNCYSLRLNRNYRKEETEIWVGKFTGKGFTQIVTGQAEWECVQRTRRIQCVDTIYTNEILLSINGKYYGPFEYDKKDGFVELSGKKENKYFISDYESEELKDVIYIVDNPESEDAVHLVAKNAIPSPMDRKYKIDWIDDDKLINYLIAILKKHGSNTKSEVRRIKENIDSLVEDDEEMFLNDDRKVRLKGLLNLVDDRDNFIQMIVKAVLENTELNKEVARVICEKHFEFIEKNSPEIKKYNDRLKELSERESSIIIQVSQAEANLEALANREREKQGDKIKEIESQIKNLLEEKGKYENEIQQLLSNIDGIKELEELEVKKKELKQEADWAQREKELRDSDLKRTQDMQKDLDKKLKDIIENFSNETKIAVDKLDKDFLNKVFQEITGEKEIKQTRFDDTLFYEQKLSGDDIINIVQNYLNDANRNVSYNEVVNYLTCIGSGFITTFAGKPGTGKTSICSLIAKALGLAGKDGNKRFIEISVERGWTSHKDFIGYYNPLTKQLEKSNAEVFDAFVRMNYEVGKKNIAPMFFLLDEANLSPIEHYWASFIKNCDFDSTVDRIISLGGNQKFHLSNNLRFLATVNFDHTTEELSPRFLDRSWIITLEPNSIDDDSFIVEPSINMKNVVSYDDFINAFGHNVENVIDDNILTKWKNIRNIFRENNLMIMPRNTKMIMEYCNTACRYMIRDTPETRFAPLDYSVAQKILPIISGPSEKYNVLVKQLQDECGSSSMPICANILDRMQKVAEDNMGYYQFFGI